MKKLWNKIRKWLIKKLGAVEDAPILPQKLVVMPSDYITVCAEQIISTDLCRGKLEYAHKVAMREIAYQLAVELLNKGYIKFETNENPYLLETRIRGTVMVCDRWR